MATETPGHICRRCDTNEVSQHIRSESVCSKCFITYVTTKAIKRMETYRTRGSVPKIPRKLLFPLSFGASSASLLHILDGHLKGQYERMNRAAYELVVVHIDLYLESVDRAGTSALLAKYKSRFPRHTYLCLGLEEALNIRDVDWKSLGIHHRPSQEPEKSPTDCLQTLITSLSSATSRADILSTLLIRLLVDVAQRNECESILFGDSTTKLAEKTLTETAKGRGFSLPWQISDGMSPYGTRFNYPMRDLLKKEVVTFCSLTLPPLDDLVVREDKSSIISASSKSTTIDDLMARYFESVEENYPSIVANVVRTSTKLQPRSSGNITSCGLCGMPVEEGTDGIFGWGGDQNSDKRTASENILCYGCARSIES